MHLIRYYHHNATEYGGAWPAPGATTFAPAVLAGAPPATTAASRQENPVDFFRDNTTFGIFSTKAQQSLLQSAKWRQTRYVFLIICDSLRSHAAKMNICRNIIRIILSSQSVKDLFEPCHPISKPYKFLKCSCSISTLQCSIPCNSWFVNLIMEVYHHKIIVFHWALFFQFQDLPIPNYGL